jgi:ribose-phosphate pyrophosphokinase
VAPYLPYMRQDKRFKPGEAITSRSYARLLSASLDFLVTVDPHLHRWHELRELYPIRAAAAAAAPAIARWIRANVTDPLLVGPDSESSQWVSQVARLCGAPWAVMQKTRRGDRNVKVVLPQGSWSDHTPVLLDDIVSTGGTLLAAVQALRKAGAAPPVCVAVHALFEDDALWRLIAAGVARVVSCDSVTHPSNAIPLAGVLAQAVRGVAKRANTPKERSP